MFSRSRIGQNSDHPIKSHQENPTPPTDYQWIVPILIGKANIKYKYSDKINILSMNGKIENDPSVLIRVKSARTFRVHFNFIALNFLFGDSKSNEREGLEPHLFFLA